MKALICQWRTAASKQINTNSDSEGKLSTTNKALCALIIISIIVGILETEVTITKNRENLFELAEIIFIVIFTIEYFLRVWTSIEDRSVKSRLHYVISPMAILDLAILFAAVFTLMGTNGFFMRIARLFRILRISKLGRYSGALRSMYRAVCSRKEELLISLSAAFLIMMISSSLLYLAESEIQPESFGSIPRAMWWSVATLTTVGYGDMYPVTITGKFFAAITAISGIGLIAIPAGILASAFNELMHTNKE